MQKVVTSPLFKKCKRVYESCENIDQFAVAKNYDYLCRKYLTNNFRLRSSKEFDFSLDLDMYLDFIRKKTKNRLEEEKM